MTEALRVYWNNDFVGQLLAAKEDFQFQYSAQWLDSAKATPISAQLPLQKLPFPDDSSRCFFANLLPEGITRSLIARQLRVSEGNDFALLAALAGDCAGALSLWPEGQSEDRPVRYEALPAERLDRMIDEMDVSPLMSPGTDLRLSLAGAQQKIPLMAEGDAFFIPHGSAASSHILKPDIPSFPGSSLNEGFCMTLARQIGISVPDIRLWRAKHTALLVARYDRRMENSLWTRLHQEDFCQALGYPHSRKYETEGGPGLKNAFQLLDKHSTQPAIDKAGLLRGVVLNVCIGNMDAHAKNYSMLMEARSYRLAPLYDLLSTRIYGSLSPKLAMRIGGQIRPEWLARLHWERLAEEALVSPKAVIEIVQETLEALPEGCVQARRILSPSTDENGVLDKIIRHITAACAALKRGLEAN